MSRDKFVQQAEEHLHSLSARIESLKSRRELAGPLFKPEYDRGTNMAVAERRLSGLRATGEDGLSDLRSGLAGNRHRFRLAMRWIVGR